MSWGLNTKKEPNKAIPETMHRGKSLTILSASLESDPV